MFILNLAYIAHFNEYQHSKQNQHQQDPSVYFHLINTELKYFEVVSNI